MTKIEIIEKINATEIEIEEKLEMIEPYMFIDEIAHEINLVKKLNNRINKMDKITYDKYIILDKKRLLNNYLKKAVDYCTKNESKIKRYINEK